MGINAGTNALTRKDKLAYTRHIANVVGVAPELLQAICFRESRMRYNAHNENDGGSPSYGVCQVKRGVAKSLQKMYKLDINVYKLSDAYANLYYAAILIKHHSRVTCKKWKGNVAQCIAYAYNTGRAPKTNTATTHYVRGVVKYMKQFNEMNGVTDICWNGRSL